MDIFLTWVYPLFVATTFSTYQVHVPECAPSGTHMHHTVHDAELHHIFIFSLKNLYCIPLVYYYEGTHTFICGHIIYECIVVQLYVVIVMYVYQSVRVHTPLL